MRVALWVAVLLAAFALAWVVQARWRQGVQSANDAAFGHAAAGSSELPEGLARAVIGAPSGADPVERRAAPAPTPPPPSGTDAEPAAGAPAGEPPPREPPARRHRVRAGETLSQICQGVYGTARAEVVQALARANGLTHPDQLRAGDELVLPPRSALTGTPR
jgi:nucleoid-associated protein YgaU